MQLVSSLIISRRKFSHFSRAIRCDKTFSEKRLLNDHTKSVHLKIKDIPCGKSFFFFPLKYLTEYFETEICGKLFSTKRHLDHHLPYHEEPRFKCEVVGCDKAFIFKSKLKDHMKIHEGSRDVKCHLCEKSFVYKKHLMLHLDDAHERTTFHCEICPFTNGRKAYLQNHLNSKHKELTDEQKKEILARVKITRKVV